MAYPVNHRVLRNLKQVLVPIRDCEVSVYDSQSGEIKQLFSDPSEFPGTELSQPVKTDVNGEVTFYVTPGRIRIDSKIDDALTLSREEVVADASNIILPRVGEVPTGDMSGASFTLIYPVYADRIMLYVDGARWKRVPSNTSPVGKQFSVNGIELLLGQAPGGTSDFFVDYWPWIS